MSLPATEQLMGYRVRCDGTTACLDSIVQSIDDANNARWLACLNPHSYAVALGRPAFDLSLKAADWLLPDGVGIVLASRFLGGHIRERITGTDIFHALHDRLQAKGGASVFFLGSTEETLAIIRAQVAHDWPALEVAGTYSPPFKPEFSDSDIDEMVRRINHARPDVLWVGISAPKQEELIHRVIDRLDVCFTAAVGAAFDFYSGRIERSSPAFQKLGLEWLPRLLQEPRRLWRRMFVSAPIFAWHVVQTRVSLWLPSKRA